MTEAPLKWIKKVPTKPGLYMRNNPDCYHIGRQYITEIEGELLASGKDGKLYGLKRWPGAKVMWWYGPIPELPDE